MDLSLPVQIWDRGRIWREFSFVNKNIKKQKSILLKKLIKTEYILNIIIQDLPMNMDCRIAFLAFLK